MSPSNSQMMPPFKTETSEENEELKIGACFMFPIDGIGSGNNSRGIMTAAVVVAATAGGEAVVAVLIVAEAAEEEAVV